MVALLLDAGITKLDIRAITSDVIKAVDEVTAANVAGIAVSREDDADGDS